MPDNENLISLIKMSITHDNIINIIPDNIVILICLMFDMLMFETC